MDVTEAREIIESMIQSLKVAPNQFQIEVNVTAQSISSTGGGIGAIISATGGQLGSTTIGQKVSMDGAQIRIAQKAGNNAIKQQMQALINSLSLISEELKKQLPDKKKIDKIYQSLKNTWVPQLITSVLGSILAQTIGTIL